MAEKLKCFPVGDLGGSYVQYLLHIGYLQLNPWQRLPFFVLALADDEALLSLQEFSAWEVPVDFHHRHGLQHCQGGYPCFWHAF